jgi:Cytochrome c2
MRFTPAFIAATMFAMALTAAHADAAKDGEVLFGRCAMCHSVTKGGGNGMGPNLFGVYGRKAGTAPGFSYSAAMKKYAKTWDDGSLRKWLAAPSKEVPGTSMYFIGLRNAKDADAVIAYLKTKK